MQVHRDEGLANRIGPESCASAREGDGEALTGEHAGQPSSPVMDIVPDADALIIAEGNISRRAIASAGIIRRGRRTWHVWTFLAREPGDLTAGQRRRVAVLVRIGKVRSRTR